MNDFYLISKYISTIYRKSKNDFNQHVAHLDVRATQSDLLLFVYEHPNFLQKQIAEQMSIDPSLVTRDLCTLEKKGLLIRQTDQQDARAKQIVLTAEGQLLARKLQEIMDEWWQNFFKQIPDLNTPIVIEELERMYVHLTTENE